MNSAVIAINSGYVHSSLAVRLLSREGGIPFIEFNVNMPKEDVLSRLSSFDVLAFSCYIWNITYVLDVVSDIKRIDENKVIILGGPSVSFDAKKLMAENPAVDYIVCGEGEDIFPQLLCNIKNGETTNCKGVLSRQDGKIFGDDSYLFASRLAPLVYEDSMVYFESTRGCPFSCSYCLSGFFKGGVRYYKWEDIQIALTNLSQLKVPVVKFVDRTFNANKEWAKNILCHLLTLDGPTRWHFEIGGDLLDDEMINLLNQGNFQVEIGIQSFNEETLKAVHRHCDLDKLCSNVNKITIHKHIDLIAGLPYEDLKSFKASFNRAYSLGADMLQLGFLKLLPGSELRQSDDIVYSSHPPYRVLRTSWISNAELCELERIEKVLDCYYNKGRFNYTLPYLEKHFSSAYDMYLALAEKLGDEVYAPIGYSRAIDNIYSLAADSIDKEILRELLRCDYYLCGARGNMPRCLSRIEYSAKAIRKAYNISKDESFFVSKINPFTLEKGYFAICNHDVRIIKMEELL